MPSDLYLFVFTDIASTEGFLIGIGITLVLLLLYKRIRDAGILVLTTIGLLVSTTLMKEWLRIPRPEAALIETTGFAFPSGHATGSLFLFFVVAYLLRRAPGRYAIFFACAVATLAIGWSRIELGVHTPLQVVAGYALGALWAAIFVWLEKKR